MEDRPPSKQAAMAPKGLGSMGEDVIEDILSKLPAKSLAYSACVCCSWNRVCNRILSRPKLLSALSLNPVQELAVSEALNKVLAEPIRPHFAIVCVGRKFSLEMTHRLVMEQLGSRISVITCGAHGVIGADAVTDEFKEVKWVEGDPENSYSSSANVDRGLVLIIGYVPGLKARIIPLIRSSVEPPPVSMIDQFVTDIKDYTVSVSGCTSPVGIIMFADQYCDTNLVLDKLDYAMSRDTVIVGSDDSGRFLYSNGDGSAIPSASQEGSLDKNTKEQTSQNLRDGAVALVFAKDRENPYGDIQFSLALSTGVSPVGPTYKGASVRVLGNKGPECSTWLTARREGSSEKLDGQRILLDIDHEVENDISSDDLYIGVVRRRKCSIGSEKGKTISSLAFHEVLGADEEYLYVKGDGIKTGDCFQFYRPDPDSALMSRNNVIEDLRALKQCGAHPKSGNVKPGMGTGNMEVCGGLMFTCFGRGESFFGLSNVDSSPFTENFPGIPVAGTFCCGEIARSSLTVQGTPIKCSLHVYSTVYFLMLYKQKKRVEI